MNLFLHIKYTQCHGVAWPGLAQVTLLAYPTEPPEHSHCHSAFLTDQYPQILALALQSL